MGYSEKKIHNSLVATAVLSVGHRCALMAVRTINTTAADAYLQLFDAASASDVSVGTTVPDWVVQADANDPSVGDGLPTDGIIFDNGIVIASTTTATGNTAATQHVRLAIQ